MTKKITVSKNGPYMVSGSVPLAIQTIGVDRKGDSTEWVEGRGLASSPKYALCRCGHSKTKPFCDGTHSKSASTVPKQLVMLLLRSRQTCLMARRCNSSMRRSYVRSHAFATRTEKFGTRWKEPAMNEYVRSIYVKWETAPLAV